MKFCDKVISFNRKLVYTGKLPAGIRVMNPFTESPDTLRISEQFYRKYYNDNNQRALILGINPGRHGAGLTGIPFTDTKRLSDICGIDPGPLSSHELSSVFVYRMIEAYGGPAAFYSKYFINSVSPLGFVRTNAAGRDVNYNYYDSREFASLLTGFITESIQQMINLGINRDTVWCLGTGKNFDFLQKLNEKHDFFSSIIPLAHPRYVMQYKLGLADNYIKDYIHKLDF